MYYYRFCPNYADDTIAYTQDQAAVLANVKTGEAFYARSGLSRDDYLSGISFLDPQEKLFVISKTIKWDKPKKDSYLYVAKLEGQEFIETGWSIYTGETSYISPDFPMYNAWSVHNCKLFVYDKERHKIICTDGKESVPHQFPEVFNANVRFFGQVKDIAIHPDLPFGVIIDENTYGNHDVAMFRWDIINPGKKGDQVVSFRQTLEVLQPDLGIKRLTFAYSSFSPDGNWYVVGLVGQAENGNAPQSTDFVAVPVTPVDKKHPYFLDINNLVVLGRVTGLTSIAWTHEPTSYVVSNGEILHKWDLDELPNARVFELPDEDSGRKKASVFQKITRLFGAGR
jgi:hypothetical protein